MKLISLDAIKISLYYADMSDFGKSDLHSVQMKILHRLLFATELRFRDLKVEELTTDHLSYHINKLIEVGLVSKSDIGTYALTDKGKEYANRMDEKTFSTEKQSKTVVLVRVVRLNNEGRLEYLVNKRLKQPFYGYVGFHTGKTREGELFIETARRELKEETGLSAKLVYVGWFHYIDFKKATGELLRDITFHTFNGYDPEGELISLNEEEGVENFWATKQQIKKMKTFPGFWDKEAELSWMDMPSTIDGNTKLNYIEKTRYIDGF